MAKPDCPPSANHPMSRETVSAIEYLTSKIDGVVTLANEREARTAERFQAADKAVSAALVASDKAVTAAMAAAEKAVAKAETAQEKRNEGSNEIRQAMVDQQKNMAGKVETDLRFENQNTRIAAMESIIANTAGKSVGVGMSMATVFQIISAVGVLITIGVVLLKG